MKEKNIKVNSILNVIKTLSSIIFPLITFPYVSRVLQPDNIGKVNFGSSFVSYFTLIATLGITTYAIRECAAVRGDKNELGKKASEIYSINICTTVVAYILLFVSLLLFRNLDSYRTLIIIQSTGILFTTLGADWLNSAMEDFAYITARTIVFQFISLILLFIFVKSPDDYLLYAAITVLSSSGANLLNVLYRRRYCRVVFTTEMKWAIHFKPIALLFVMILAQTIFNSADITMLGLMKGDYEVGLYSSAVKIKQLVSQIVTSLAWVIMPRMSLYFEQKDYIQINRMLRKILSVLITLGLPCVVGVWCLSKEILLIIAGEQYVAAATSLNILMIGFVFSLVGGSFLGNMVLLPSKREATYMKICVVSTMVNLVLNYFLIPIWGVNAASGTTAFSGFLIMIMTLFTVDKSIYIENMKSVFIPPIIGCFAMAFLCYMINHLDLSLWLETFMSVSFSIMVYFTIQLIFKNDIVIEEVKVVRDKVFTKWIK